MRSGTENQITLVVIRHGETKANREHRYLGKTEESLSMEGIEKLQQNKLSAKYPKVDMLFASPMKRCRETGAILYPDIHPHFISDWKEMDFGDFEGKNYEELKTDHRYQEWIDSGGTLPFPGGESRETFISRCEAGLREMAGQILKNRESNHDDSKTAGLIVHGGTIMALLSRFAGGEYFEYQVPNGEGYVCSLTYGEGELQLKDIRRL